MIPATRRTFFDRWCIIMQTRHAPRRTRDGLREGSRMRLLYLQPSSTFGGAERQASIAVPLLTKLGFDVTTMVGPSTSGLDWLREYGVDDLVHTPDFPGGWRKPRGFERLALPGRYLRCVRRVAAQVHRVAVERGADIIFAAMAFSWVAATPVARQLGIPIVWRAGGTEGGIARASGAARLGGVQSTRPADLLRRRRAPDVRAADSGARRRGSERRRHRAVRPADRRAGLVPAARAPRW